MYKERVQRERREKERKDRNEQIRKQTEQRVLRWKDWKRTQKERDDMTPAIALCDVFGPEWKRKWNTKHGGIGSSDRNVVNHQNANNRNKNHQKTRDSQNDATENEDKGDSQRNDSQSESIIGRVGEGESDCGIDETEESDRKGMEGVPF